MSKPRVAIFDFACCEGCQLQIVNLEEEILNLIDVVDVASDKLVWRGVSSQALPDLSDPQQLTDRVNETVTAVLKQFPPGRGE